MFFGVKRDASLLGLGVGKDGDGENGFFRMLLTKLLDSMTDGFFYPFFVSLPIICL